MPPLTALRLLTTWVADPAGIALALVLLVAYAAGVRAVRRRGLLWPLWRTALFAVVGVGSLVLATCGGVAAYRGYVLWAGGLQAAVLSALTPLGLALGDPVGLLRTATGGRVGLVERALRSGLVRVLMFPMLSSVLAVGTLVLVFVTPYYAASVRSVVVRDLLYLNVLLTGSLFILPLLGEELLPSWCTYPVRVLFGFADGLLDAIPGAILVGVRHRIITGVPGLVDHAWGLDPLTDQHYAGGALLVVGEGIGLPFLAVLIVGWLREDARAAQAVDAVLDAQETASRTEASPHASPTSADSASAAPPQPDRPWWESDPRFAGRYAPRRGDNDES